MQLWTYVNVLLPGYTHIDMIKTRDQHIRIQKKCPFDACITVEIKANNDRHNTQNKYYLGFLIYKVKLVTVMRSTVKLHVFPGG